MRSTDLVQKMEIYEDSCYAGVNKKTPKMLGKCFEQKYGRYR